MRKNYWVSSRSHCMQFGETNPESPFQPPEWNKKETEKKRILQKAIVTAGGSELVSQTKIAYSDFFKNYSIKKISGKENLFQTSLRMIW